MSRPSLLALQHGHLLPTAILSSIELLIETLLDPLVDVVVEKLLQLPPQLIRLGAARLIQRKRLQYLLHHAALFITSALRSSQG
jgi:hypothetical protein